MGMSDVVRAYADKEIVISNDPRRCIHAAECTRGLPAVFDIARRLWIMPSGARADEITAMIAKCPSGALHFTRLDGGSAEISPEDNTIVPTPMGPLCVMERIQLLSADGSLIVKDTRLTLCRCGQSHNKPFVTIVIAIPALTIPVLSRTVAGRLQPRTACRSQHH
jgi:uncharacterized Fe-S cluster protein YjdI